MKFGIAFANIGPMGTPEGAAGIGRTAEAAGFDSLWTVEHVLVPVGYQSTYPYSPTGKMPGPEESDIPDPLIWLAFVAAATSTIRLGTGILILPERNPIVVGKEIATLDRLSGGRVELGVGVGWLEEEFHALGIPWERRGEPAASATGSSRARATTTSCASSSPSSARAPRSTAATPTPSRSPPAATGRWAAAPWPRWRPCASWACTG